MPLFKLVVSIFFPSRPSVHADRRAGPGWPVPSGGRCRLRHGKRGGQAGRRGQEGPRSPAVDRRAGLRKVSSRGPLRGSLWLSSLGDGGGGRYFL